LQLEQIPLYQFHRIDPHIPIEDSIGMLRTLQDEGKIRHIGVSNVNDRELDRALSVTPVVSVQNRYGPGERSSESMLDRCEQEGFAFLPWGPLDQGAVRRNPVLQRIADTHGATTRQVALAWLLARSPVMVPIPGTGSLPHLEENLEARSLELTGDEIAELNRT
jgi:aryl-alcohol dehydrogenase-like predicted oxidoreductase